MARSVSIKNKQANTAAVKVKLLLTDVDGVMTDGRLFYVGRGHGVFEEFKGFHSHDGIALIWARENGLVTGLISGRNSPGVAWRAQKLGMRYVVQEKVEKLPAYLEILRQGGFREEEAAFIGDDILDLPVMRRCGLPVAVADARPEVLAAAIWTAPHPGGAGALRDAVEFILKAQGKWRKILEKY